MAHRATKRLKRLLITASSFIGICIVIAIIYSEITIKLLFEIGYHEVYRGNNDRGNKIMIYALSKADSITYRGFHSLSVQNTKNGNYNLAIPALEKAAELNPSERGYYGWVLLYYYHDYERALEQLEKYDALTPDFVDVAGGEDIYYLKGLTHMQLKNHSKAVKEFNLCITHISSTIGEEWVDVYAFVNKGRSLAQLDQHEEAVESYLTAIKNYDKCAEAYYFMGLSQLKINQNGNACLNFKKALELVKKGYKSSDSYVELFHEIYDQQIEKSISINCS